MGSLQQSALTQFIPLLCLKRIGVLALFLLCIPLISNAQCKSPDGCDLPPSLFVSRSNLEYIRDRLEKNAEPYGSFAKSFFDGMHSTLNSTPDPFFMDNIKQITFGWCDKPAGKDDTLKELTGKLNHDSSQARDLAVAYLLSGDERYADKAKAFLLAWVNGSSLVNVYDFNIDFKATTFDGVEEGFCNNSWNMALDSMWQTYGLINFSDVYIILTRNGYVLPESEHESIRNWLQHKLLPAVNAGCHAWTRRADAHPQSKVYQRYRSDNHLSWCLAGWSAAAAALDDDKLWKYAYQGGVYDDGRSGPYANPSNFEAHVGYAIYPSGEIYDQAVRSSSHKGLFYGNFSLWSMALAAQIAEVHRGIDYWTYTGSQGGSLKTAFDFYAPFTAGDVPAPDAKEKTDPAFFRFVYEMLISKQWVTGEREALYKRARGSKPRTQIITQSFGPVSLLMGDLPAPESK